MFLVKVIKAGRESNPNVTSLFLSNSRKSKLITSDRFLICNGLNMLLLLNHPAACESWFSGTCGGLNLVSLHYSANFMIKILSLVLFLQWSTRIGVCNDFYMCVWDVSRRCQLSCALLTLCVPVPELGCLESVQLFSLHNSSDHCHRHMWWTLYGLWPCILSLRRGKSHDC